MRGHRPAAEVKEERFGRRVGSKIEGFERAKNVSGAVR